RLHDGAGIDVDDGRRDAFDDGRESKLDLWHRSGNGARRVSQGRDAQEAHRERQHEKAARHGNSIRDDNEKGRPSVRSRPQSNSNRGKSEDYSSPSSWSRTSTGPESRPLAASSRSMNSMKVI